MEDSTRISELAHALQYGTSEEAEDALRQLLEIKKEGELPPGSGAEKILENYEMRQKIEQQREDEVSREISGGNQFDDFEPEPTTVDGVMIQHGATYKQRMLRPVIKAYPNVMNTLSTRQNVADLVDKWVEEADDKSLYDDPDIYLKAAEVVHEIETKADRIDEDHVRSEAFEQYRTARGKQFKEEE
jgi:hypothetical protein